MTAVDTWIAQLLQYTESANPQPLISQTAVAIAALQFLAGGGGGTITQINGTANQIDVSTVGGVATVSLDANVQIATSLSIGGLAIGTNTLAVNGTINQQSTLTGTSGGIPANEFFTAVAPSGATTGTYSGVRSAITYTSAQTSAAGNLSGVVGLATVAGTLGGGMNQVNGCYGIAAYTGSTDLSGTTQSLYGGRFQAQVTGTGNYNHALGIKIDGTQVAAGVTVNYLTGLYVQDVTANVAGTATTSDAIHIEGAGASNSIGFSGHGGSDVNAKIWSASQNVLQIDATSGLTLNAPTTISTGIATATVLTINGLRTATGTITGTSGGLTFDSSIFTIQAAGASTASYSGIRSAVLFNSSANSSGSVIAVNALCQAFTTATFAGLSNYGIVSKAQASGTGGAYAAGTVFASIDCQIQTTSSTVPVAIGVKIESPAIATGIVTSFSGIYIDDTQNGLTSGGTTTRASAVLIAGNGASNAIAFGNAAGTTGVNTQIYSDVANNLKINATAGVTMTGTLTTGDTNLARSTAGYGNNAAAQVATITNGPTAGNPTKWIPINDNGVTRNIPAW